MTMPPWISLSTEPTSCSSASIAHEVNASSRRTEPPLHRVLIRMATRSARSRLVASKLVTPRNSGRCLFATSRASSLRAVMTKTLMLVLLAASAGEAAAQPWQCFQPRPWADHGFLGNLGTYFADMNGDGFADAVAITQPGGT